MKTLQRLMVTTIIMAVASLSSFGLMQSEPSFEEMRQLRQEARALRPDGPTARSSVKGLVEAAAAPQALQFNFDDSGFNYYDKEEGYVQLGYDASAGSLTLKLQERADGMLHSFPEIGRLNPEDHNRLYLERYHIASFDRRNLLADEQARLHERVNITQENGSLEIIHQEAYLSPVEDYYLSSFDSFGFETELKSSASNSRNYTITNGTFEANLQLTRMGTDIRVRLDA